MVENLSRWLRSVRPKTLADDDWATTPAADEVLAAVHRAIASAGQPEPAVRRRRRAVGRWAWAPAGAIACAVLALTLVSGQAPPPTPPGPSGVAIGPTLPALRPAAMLLDNYTSCGDLLTGLRNHAAAHPRAFERFAMFGGVADSGLGAKAATGVAAAGAAPTSPSDTSTTNVQEIGVDEPDIVKTDGGRLISITDGVLHVVDAASRKVTGTLDLTMYQGAQGAQLLVGGEHALVILSGDSPAGLSGGTPYYREGVPAGRSSLSTYLFVDLNGQPRVTGSLRASGSYLDARMVGTTIRLVVSSSPALNVPFGGAGPAARTRVKRITGRAPLAAWVPQYSITDGSGTTKHAVPCNQISHPAHYTAASMLSIYTLELTDLAASPDPVSVAADGDTVYASATSLYVASNPNWYCCAPSSGKQNTEIHRFDIAGSKQPTYLGSGQVSGRLLSQYSLSDYAGSLRVATTSGDVGRASGESSSVFVLDADTLKITGQVDGLGSGEQIYAVRFEGPTAYVVTFKQTDPLYVLDLADPSAPKLTGTLTLTGYSDYLHDAGNGRLIGVGQEASPQGRVAGMQVSLFDVRSPAEPRRTGHVVLKHTQGEDTLDPHAFLYWQPTGLLVVPVQSWTPAQSGKVLVLSVSGPTLREVGELANPRASGAIDDGLGIQRSVLVAGALWTVSGSGVQISDATTLERRAWVAFG